MKITSLVVSVLFGVCLLSTSTQAALVTQTGMNGGVVVDTVTGYKWQKNQQGGNQWDHKTATAYCESLTIGDYTDWRMPTKEELATTPYAMGTVLSFTFGGLWTSTPGTSNPSYRFYRDHLGRWFDTVVTNRGSVRCVVNTAKTVTVPTSGFYKFRMEQGVGVVTAKVNGATVLTVDTSYGGNEVVIGDLVAGEVVAITVNGKGATSVGEEALPEFPFIQWRHTYAAGAIELVLYDPLPEAPVCAVTEEDLADAQNQLSLANETIRYTEGQLADVRGQLAVSSSALAQANGELSAAQATIATKDHEIASLKAQVAFLLAQDCNNGHGNDPGKIDISNPGNSKK